MSIHDTMSRIVGEREQITRTEMRDILARLPELADHSTIAGRFADGALCLGDRRIEDRDRESIETATAWANACEGIRCISVLAYSDGDYHVRYDDPGSMHPLQRAAVTFVPAAIDDGRTDGGSSIEYMRRHAERVLLVSGERIAIDEPEAEAAAPAVPAWVERLRALPDVDGTWIRVLDDGTLEMRDPNDGIGADPREKTRYQYRVDEDGYVFARRLPPESVGDEWTDIGEPEWEPRSTPPRDGIVRAWWDAQVM